MSHTQNDNLYELRAEWLSDHDRSEDDLLVDEDGKQYVMSEKREWSEVDGLDIDYDTGFYKRIYLPDNFQELK